MASKSSLLRFRCRRSVGRLIGSLNQQTSSGLVKPLSLVELQNGSASSSQTEWLWLLYFLAFDGIHQFFGL